MYGAGRAGVWGGGVMDGMKMELEMENGQERKRGNKGGKRVESSKRAINGANRGRKGN